MREPEDEVRRRALPAKVSGLLLGLWPGGFVDGILLHQILQSLNAIHAAARGALVLGRGASKAVVAAAGSAPRVDALSALDARGLEILDLLVQGLPTSQVASRLFLAPKTVRNRISEMLAKLGVASRDEAIALGRAGGLGHRSDSGTRRGSR